MADIATDQREGAQALAQEFCRVAGEHAVDGWTAAFVPWEDLPEREQDFLITVFTEIYPWITKQLADILWVDVALKHADGNVADLLGALSGVDLEKPVVVRVNGETTSVAQYLSSRNAFVIEGHDTED